MKGERNTGLNETSKEVECIVIRKPIPVQGYPIVPDCERVGPETMREAAQIVDLTEEYEAGSVQRSQSTGTKSVNQSVETLATTENLTLI